MLRILSLILLAGTLFPAYGETLKIATISPEGSSWMRIMRKGADEVAQRTQQRVTIKFYGGGAMGDDKAVLRKMRVGQLQGAAVTSGSITQIYTDVQAYNLPMVFGNEQELNYVRARMDGDIEQGIEAKGYEVLGFAEAGFAHAFSRLPATSPQGARAQRTWAPDADPASVVAVKAFGIDPVSLTIIDVLPMLQSGSIDAVVMPPVGVIALQWHTQLKYVLDLPLVYVYGTIILDQRAFKKLSVEDQQTVRQVMGAAMQEIDAYNRQDHRNALAALKKQGLQFLHPSAADLVAWRAASDTAIRETLAAGLVTPAAYERLTTLLREARAAASGKPAAPLSTAAGAVPAAPRVNP